MTFIHIKYEYGYSLWNIPLVPILRGSWTRVVRISAEYVFDGILCSIATSLTSSVNVFRSVYHVQTKKGFRRPIPHDAHINVVEPYMIHHSKTVQKLPRMCGLVSWLNISIIRQMFWRTTWSRNSKQRFEIRADDSKSRMVHIDQLIWPNIFGPHRQWSNYMLQCPKFECPEIFQVRRDLTRGPNDRKTDIRL